MDESTNKRKTRSSSRKKQKPSSNTRSKKGDDAASTSKDIDDSEQPHTSKEDNSKSTTSPDRGETTSPEPNCAICLGLLENKSFTDSCFHMFCFVCLVEWSKVKAECPLCKQKFQSIIHNVRSYDDYDQYHIQQEQNRNADAPRFRYRTTLTLERRLMIGFNDDGMHTEHDYTLQRPSRVSGSAGWRRTRQAATSEFRRRIYHNGLQVSEVRNRRSLRQRDITPEFFRHNEAASHRLVPWLNRELNALLYNNDHVALVLDLILGLIKTYPISSEEFYQHVYPYIGRHTHHFMHEFESFAKSPHEMRAYDQKAVYTPHAVMVESETDSSSDSDGDDDVIVISSSDPAPIMPPSIDSHMHQPGRPHAYNYISPLLESVRNFLEADTPPYARAAPPPPPPLPPPPPPPPPPMPSMGFDTSFPAYFPSLSALHDHNQEQLLSQIPVPGSNLIMPPSLPPRNKPPLPSSNSSASTSSASRNPPLPSDIPGPSHQLDIPLPSSPVNKKVSVKIEEQMNSDSDSETSDVIFVGYDKPYEERSPVPLSSDSEAEALRELAYAQKMDRKFSKTSKILKSLSAKDKERDNRRSKSKEKEKSKEKSSRKSKHSSRHDRERTRRRSRSLSSEDRWTRRCNRRRSRSRSRSRSKERQYSRQRRRSWSNSSNEARERIDDRENSRTRSHYWRESSSGRDSWAGKSSRKRDNRNLIESSSESDSWTGKSSRKPEKRNKSNKQRSRSVTPQSKRHKARSKSPKGSISSKRKRPGSTNPQHVRSRKSPSPMNESSKQKSCSPSPQPKKSKQQHRKVDKDLQSKHRTKSRSKTPEPVNSRQRNKSRSVTPKPVNSRKRNKSRSVTPKPVNSRKRNKSRSVTPQPVNSRQRNKSRSITPQPVNSRQRNKSRSVTPQPPTSRQRTISSSEEQEISKHASRSITPQPVETRQRSRSPQSSQSRNRSESLSPQPVIPRQRSRSSTPAANVLRQRSVSLTSESTVSRSRQESYVISDKHVAENIDIRYERDHHRSWSIETVSHKTKKPKHKKDKKHKKHSKKHKKHKRMDSTGEREMSYSTVTESQDRGHADYLRTREIYQDEVNSITSTVSTNTQDPSYSVLSERERKQVSYKKHPTGHKKSRKENKQREVESVPGTSENRQIGRNLSNYELDFGVDNDSNMFGDKSPVMSSRRKRKRKSHKNVQRHPVNLVELSDNSDDEFLNIPNISHDLLRQDLGNIPASSNEHINMPFYIGSEPCQNIFQGSEEGEIDSLDGKMDLLEPLDVGFPLHLPPFMDTFESSLPGSKKTNPILIDYEEISSDSDFENSNFTVERLGQSQNKFPTSDLCEIISDDDDEGAVNEKLHKTESRHMPSSQKSSKTNEKGDNDNEQMPTSEKHRRKKSHKSKSKHSRKKESKHKTQDEEHVASSDRRIVVIEAENDQGVKGSEQRSNKSVMSSRDDSNDIRISISDGEIVDEDVRETSDCVIPSHPEETINNGTENSVSTGGRKKVNNSSKTGSSSKGRSEEEVQGEISTSSNKSDSDAEIDVESLNPEPRSESNMHIGESDRFGKNLNETEMDYNNGDSTTSRIGRYYSSIPSENTNRYVHEKFECDIESPDEDSSEDDRNVTRACSSGSQSESKTVQDRATDSQSESKTVQDRASDSESESKTVQDRASDSQSESKTVQDRSSDSQSESKTVQDRVSDSQSESKTVQDRDFETWTNSKKVQAENSDSLSENDKDQKRDPPSECKNIQEKNDHPLESENAQDRNYDSLSEIGSVRDENCDSSSETGSVQDENCDSPLESKSVQDENCDSSLESNSVQDKNCGSTMASRNVPENCVSPSETKDIQDKNCDSSFDSKNVQDESCNSYSDSENVQTDKNCYSQSESDNIQDENCDVAQSPQGTDSCNDDDICDQSSDKYSGNEDS